MNNNGYQWHDYEYDALHPVWIYYVSFGLVIAFTAFVLYFAPNPTELPSKPVTCICK